MAVQFSTMDSNSESVLAVLKTAWSNDFALFWVICPSDTVKSCWTAPAETVSDVEPWSSMLSKIILLYRVSTFCNELASGRFSKMEK